MIAIVAQATILFPFAPVHADPVRDFVVSCSYGVLAGTLVGAATLAFSDKPGDNLNKVARGASLGLYAGILLGAYVVYGVPGEEGPTAEELRAVGLHDRPGSRTLITYLPKRSPPILIAPVIGERGVDGVSARWNVMTF